MKGNKFSPTRMTMTFRSPMYYGKTVLCAMTVGRLQEEHDRNVIVYLITQKHEDSKPWYEKYCENVKYYKGLTYGNIRRYKNSILVFEDIPSWRYRKGYHIIDQMLSTLARANNTFTILTNQKPRYKPTPVEVHLNMEDDQRLMMIRELRNETDWIPYEEFDESAIDPIIDAIYNGVKGKKKGLIPAGRKPVKGSLQQKVFKMLDEGISIGKIANKYPDKKQTIYIYHERWKRRRGLM